MTTLNAFILGIVQGLTEFLPISSSGHLVLIETIANLEASKYLFFDVLVHVATLIAVCFFFRARLWQLSRELIFAPISNQNMGNTIPAKRYVAALVLSSVITASIALVFKDQLVAVRDHLDWVAVSFIVTGVLLMTTKWAKSSDTQANPIPMNLWLFSVVMGLVQTVAIVPGISRSGSTVCVALLLGVSKSTAVEYSFLMCIPVILGASVLELRNAEFLIGFGPAALGFIVALVVGWMSLGLLVRFVNSGRLYLFAFYLIPLGLWCLFWM